MSYFTERIAQEINDFITEKTKDLDNHNFREVMNEVHANVGDQLDALEQDDPQDEDEEE